LLQHGAPVGIGFENVGIRIHEEESGADSIKRITQCCGFSRMTIDELADPHCSAQMRSEQAQPIDRRPVH
jgi:hypothetical protein